MNLLYSSSRRCASHVPRRNTPTSLQANCMQAGLKQEAAGCKSDAALRIHLALNYAELPVNKILIIFSEILIKCQWSVKIVKELNEC